MDDTKNVVDIELFLVVLLVGDDAKELCSWIFLIAVVCLVQ